MQSLFFYHRIITLVVHISMEKVLKYHNPHGKTHLSNQADLKSHKMDQKVQKKVTFNSVQHAEFSQRAHHKHPFSHFLRGTNPNFEDFKKFAVLFYRGLSYSVNNLKGPSQEFIKKKSVTLPDANESKKKYLLLDLDETLIHSVFNDSVPTDVSFEHAGSQFKFNVRPHCIEFLQRMSKLYTIHVFTASTVDYATPIVNYLNKNKKTIQGILHRKNCMETNKGFFIKDLRIIKNRDLKNMVIVDNLVHSFGLQIQNGIPILDFTDDKNDHQLLGLEVLLTELHQVEDVRDFLKDKLKLRTMLAYSQKQVMEYFQSK